MEFVWGFFVFHQFLSMVLFKNGGFLFDFFFFDEHRSASIYKKA